MNCELLEVHWMDRWMASGVALQLLPEALPRLGALQDEPPLIDSMRLSVCFSMFFCFETLSLAVVCHCFFSMRRSDRGSCPFSGN